MYEVMIEEEFSAAHALRGYRGKCENMHGHNWKVEVYVRGEQLDQVVRRARRLRLSNYDRACFHTCHGSPVARGLLRILLRSSLRTLVKGYKEREGFVN